MTGQPIVFDIAVTLTIASTAELTGQAITAAPDIIDHNANPEKSS